MAISGMMIHGPLAWRHLAEPPQGRNAARVGGLWRVRGRFLLAHRPVCSLSGGTHTIVL